MNIEEILNKISEYENKNLHISALTLWEKIIEKKSKEFYLFRYADLLRLCGFFSKAEGLLLSINENTIPVKYQYNYFLYLGQLYKDWGRLKEAKNAFLKSINLNPDLTVPYIFLSSVLMDESDVDEAISYLKIALTKDGDIDEVNYNIARRLVIKGEMLEALNAINECLKIDSEFPDAEDFKNDIIKYFEIKNIEIEDSSADVNIPV
jgi:tetratricopeptide (TPR) repeat protein